jgi:hypothetical protein
VAVPTFISASTGSEASALSVTVNRPSGLTGRTLLRMYCSAQSATATWNTPSGWTQIDIGNVAGGNPFGYAVFERIIPDATALGSEASSYTVGIAGATNRSLQVGIAAYESFADSPQGAHAKTHDGDTQSTTIPMPDVTTTGTNSVICRAAFGGSQTTLGSGQYIDAVSSPLNARKRFEAQAASSLRPHALFDEEQASPGAAGVENATQAESLVHVGMSTEILELVPIETLRPTATRNVTGLTPNTDPSAYQTIDDDPDSGGTDFLTGTDPSGTPPDIQRITGADNTGNPTTTTSVTVPTVQVNDIILVSVVNGDGTAQPTISDNSGVGSWTNGTGGGVVLHQTGTAMAGTVFWKRITNAGSESGAVVSLSGMTGSTCANVGVWRGCVTSGSPVDGTPVGEGNASANNTQAQITTATDGARVILNVFYSDNTAVTTNMATATSPGALTKHTEIYSSGGNDSGLATASAVKTTAGATGAFTWAPGTNQISASIGFALKPHFVAGSTTNTKVEAIMDNPVNTLATGTATGQIKIQVKKLGSGTNPTVKAEIHENASGTVLATAIADTAVSDTTSGGIVLTGTFNQSVITNPANVEVWVIGTGASGGLVEIGAVEWNAQYTLQALAGQSRGLLYNVNALAGQNRQLLYNVSNLAAQNRVLSYNISNRAGQSRQLLYNVTGQARADRQLLYNVSGLATQSRQLFYNISGRAGQSRQLLYDLRALAGQNRSLLYNISALAGQSRQALYDVRALAGQSRQILFDVLQEALIAGASRSVLYNVSALARGDRQVLYNVSTKAAQSRQILYNVSNMAGQNRTLLYDLRALARGDRQVLYNISGLATQSRQVLYNISTHAGQSRSLLYNISALAGQNRELLFNVLANALLAGASRGILYNVSGLSRQDRQLLYNISARAGQNRQLLHNVSALSGQNRQLLYNVSGIAAQQRQLLYNVSGKAGAQRNILYNISSRAGQSRQILYDLLANALFAGASRSIVYNVTGQARGDRQLLYNVSTRAGQNRQVLYNISSRAGQSRVLSYAIRAFAAQQRTLMYDVRALARGDRTLSYDIYSRAGAQRQILYNISALAAAQRTILYNVRGLAGTDRTILYNILSHLITLQYALQVELENPLIVTGETDSPYGIEVVSDKPLELDLSATH